MGEGYAGLLVSVHEVILAEDRFQIFPIFKNLFEVIRFFISCAAVMKGKGNVFNNTLLFQFFCTGKRAVFCLDLVKESSK
jgi:hypothetical protein